MPLARAVKVTRFLCKTLDLDFTLVTQTSVLLCADCYSHPGGASQVDTRSQKHRVSGHP